MVSKSPDRNTFQKEKYIERCQKDGKEPSPDYLEMFANDAKHRETDWILEKVRNSESYAQNLYAAMCNTDFIRNDVWPLLTEQKWGCSWRYAGGIIADMRQEGDYIDWYCSGIRGDMAEPLDPTDEQRERMSIVDKFVGEGCVTDEIRNDLFKLGWIVIQDDDTNI